MQSWSPRWRDNELCVAGGKKGAMTIDPWVFEMRVGAVRVLEDRSGGAVDEFCIVEAG
jgi:hypothetical protein